MQYAPPKYQGDPTIASLANGLGTLGRYGDSYMVHAAEGETVVPAEVLAANPELKNQLFWQMRMMGIQDPNRYVVGNNLNSINPITGQPEFFFKKIFRAIKKIFKKALPIIAPIIGNFIAPGIGGIIASALVTKLQGGSWGDVLKSAALSYGVGAFAQGISGGIAGLAEGAGGFGSGFAGGLGAGLKAPFQAASNIFAGTPFSAAPASLNPFAQGIFGPGGTGTLFSAAAAPVSTTTQGMANILRQASVSGGGISGSLYAAAPVATAGAGAFSGVGSSLLPGGYKQGIFPTYDPGTVLPPAALSPTTQGFANTLRQANVSGGTLSGTKFGAGPVPTGSVSSVPAEKYYTDIKDQVRADGTAVRTGVIDGSRQEIPSPPSLISRVLGGDKAAMGQLAGKTAETLALPLTLAGAAYFFTTDDVDNVPQDQLSGWSTERQDAYDQYLARGGKKDATGRALLVEAGISPTQDAATLSNTWNIPPEDAQAFLDSFYGTGATPATTATAARGGIVGLQGGGEITGLGTGTSDSIPARLSDGEFVMTADAVRGIGNGNRNLGAARMYDLMSRYENGIA